MGKVSAGLMQLQRFKPIEATRYSSPVNFTWPKRIFFLDRCFLVTKYLLDNNKQLVIINLHNSAFDDGVVLRQGEIKLLKDLMMLEYNVGNYVIAGGDWNMSPPAAGTSPFKSGESVKGGYQEIDKNIFPADWQWVFDSAYPTNRDANVAYSKGYTPVNLIDFFLITPNIAVNEIRTLSYGFSYSDHNPVYLRVRLKN
jgi:endonuclease/exonuclease/phosphatase family metal-dependent hydrolase